MRLIRIAVLVRRRSRPVVGAKETFNVASAGQNSTVRVLSNIDTIEVIKKA